MWNKTLTNLEHFAVFIPDIEVIAFHLQTDYLKKQFSYVSLFGFQVVQMFFEDHFGIFINGLQFIGVKFRGEWAGHFVFMREFLLFPNDGLCENMFAPGFL